MNEFMYRIAIYTVVMQKNIDPYIVGEASTDESSPDWVPSLFSHDRQDGRPMEKVARLERKRKRDARAEEASVNCPPADDLQRSEEPEEPEETMVPEEAVNSLQHKYDQLNTEYWALTNDYYRLHDENVRLKAELEQSRFSFRTVKDKPNYLLFLTGLSLVIFMWLLSKIKCGVQKIYSNLTLEDHFLMVLMKLRMGLCNRDLAYRFRVSETTVSNILRSWLPSMAKMMKPIIKWPTKGTRCIIDCTEVFTERPSNLTARAQTWSNYKHNNTIKFLVGITPAGAVSFLSKGWGGRVSDKEITIESGFLDLVEPRDQILADRGFLIRDELAVRGATLRIPSFTKGKSQLPAPEVETSRALSRVRIHVERVIRRWKSFKILQTVIPISQIGLLDNMVIVCAALTNLSKSVVPK